MLQGFGSVDTSSAHLVPFYLGIFAEVGLNGSYGSSIISFFEDGATFPTMGALIYSFLQGTKVPFLHIFIIFTF